MLKTMFALVQQETDKKNLINEFARYVRIADPDPHNLIETFQTDYEKGYFSLE